MAKLGRVGASRAGDEPSFTVVNDEEFLSLKLVRVESKERGGGR